MYYAMAAIAWKHKISIGEVKITLLRSVLERDHGFTCDHPDDKLRVSHSHRYYCSGCWRFMRKMRRISPKPGQDVYYFIPKKTFMDEIASDTNDLMAGLKPDQRGGE